MLTKSRWRWYWNFQKAFSIETTHTQKTHKKCVCVRLVEEKKEQKTEKINKSNEQQRNLPSESISPSSIASRDTSTKLDVCGADFSVIKNWIWSDSSTSFFRGFGGGMIASHFGRSKLSRLPWRANFSPKYFDSKLFIHFTNGPNGPYLDVCFASKWW